MAGIRQWHPRGFLYNTATFKEIVKDYTFMLSTSAKHLEKLE